MAGTCTWPLCRPSLDTSSDFQLANHETVNLADLQSYDHRRSQADGRSQSMVWGNAQPMYSQYPLSAPYPMFDQYSCFSGLYPQPSLQETPFNQLYQLPQYSWQTSMQDGLTGPVHGTDFGMEPRTDILSSPTMLGVQSQVEGQALASSDSAGSSGSPSVDARRKYKDRITSGHGDRRGSHHLRLRHLVATERIRWSDFARFELRDQTWLDRCQRPIRG
jgi:hypothetical protein